MARLKLKLSRKLLLRVILQTHLLPGSWQAPRWHEDGPCLLAVLRRAVYTLSPGEVPQQDLVMHVMGFSGSF
ncbi:hypothetical protein I79_019526 [Cricetulus griseus]|uniref:Uncharacterized protein n=1 Tax=Cricetulus griseus TaxID=10029 RepID=G3I7N2_CRIGR|nr:hypothetical protein I79_019526 [Cricetulus griseus]